MISEVTGKAGGLFVWLFRVILGGVIEWLRKFLEGVLECLRRRRRTN